MFTVKFYVGPYGNESFMIATFKTLALCLRYIEALDVNWGDDVTRYSIETP